MFWKRIINSFTKLYCNNCGSRLISVGERYTEPDYQTCPRQGCPGAQLIHN